MAKVILMWKEFAAALMVGFLVSLSILLFHWTTYQYVLCLSTFAILAALGLLTLFDSRLIDGPNLPGDQDATLEDIPVKVNHYSAIVLAIMVGAYIIREVALFIAQGESIFSSMAVLHHNVSICDNTIKKNKQILPDHVVIMKSCAYQGKSVAKLFFRTMGSSGSV